MEVDKCFPPSHPLNKILNRNTVKISYRCMPNMKQVLSKHNAKLSKPQQAQLPPPGCNCQGGTAKCPLAGACLTEGVVYEAKVVRGKNFILAIQRELLKTDFMPMLPTSDSSTERELALANMCGN